MSKGLSISKAIIILICFNLVSMTWADIWSPAVVNFSFEDPELASGGQSNDINEWFDAVAYTYTSDDASTDHPETPYGDNWAELGNNRWIYQQIGTYEENMQLEISFLTGQRGTKAFTSVYVTLLVGGNPELAADIDLKYGNENPLETRVGAVQIVRSEAIAPFASTAKGISGQSVSFSTGTGYTVGAPLWIQINKDNNTGRALIDNVVVAKATDDPWVVNPTPGDSLAGVDPVAELNWDSVNTTAPSFDVNIGTTTACDDIVSGLNTGSNAIYTPGLGLFDYMTTYYWRIDITEDATEYQGSVWSFTTGGKAVNPVPADGAVADRNVAWLSWTGCDFVSWYDVYFGPVGNMRYLGSSRFTSVSFEVLAATFSSDFLPAGQYQWQVNTLDKYSDIIVEGDVWDVTVPEFEPQYIDDFSSYTDTSELLRAWSTNGSSATVQLYDHFGAMELVYDNSQPPWGAQVSFDPTSDLSSDDHTVLSVSFFGKNTNSIEEIYIIFYDQDSTGVVVYKGDNTTATDSWWDWYIELDEIAEQGIDLAKVTKLSLHIDNLLLPGGTGTIYIDDIVLLDTRVCDGDNPVDLNGDCLVDALDVLELAGQWLMADYIVASSVPTVSPEASYKFEERTGTVVYDVTNDNNAAIEMNGVTDFWEMQGHDSQGSLKLTGDLKLLIPEAVFAGVGDAVTISMWVQMDEQDIEQVELMAGDVPMVDNFWQFADWSATDASSGWVHFAAVIDAGADAMKVYCNGELVAENVNAEIVIAGDSAGATSIQLDTGIGTVIIDDVSIYSTALTHREIVALALSGGSVLQRITPLMTNADIHADGRINLNDLAIIAQTWLQ